MSDLPAQNSSHTNISLHQSGDNNLFKNKFSSRVSSFIQKGIIGSQNIQPDLTSSKSQPAPTQSPRHILEQKQPEPRTQVNTQQKLDLFEKALDEAELDRQSEASVAVNQDTDLGLAAQAYSQADDGRTLAEDVGQRSNLGRKEAPIAVTPLTTVEKGEPASLDQVNNLQLESSASSTGEQGVGVSVEQAASIQYVEEERSPELSPEVEKYIEEVKKQQKKAPREIVIADDDANLPNQEQYVSEPVVVVPITPEIEEKGKRQPPKFSVRWLVEWSQKIIKMFTGKVVYRRVEG